VSFSSDILGVEKRKYGVWFFDGRFKCFANIQLNLVKVGDIVYSFANSHIKAIGVVSKQHLSYKKPAEFGEKGANWGDEGWLVCIDWLVLSKSFRPKEHIEDLSPFLPEKYSPIQKSGNGNQSCYLASISHELHEELMTITLSLDNQIDEKLVGYYRKIESDAEVNSPVYLDTR